MTFNEVNYESLSWNVLLLTTNFIDWYNQDVEFQIQYTICMHGKFSILQG